MSVLPVGFGSALGGYQIERSLRFNSADSAFLSRTLSSSGDMKVFTLSFWLKRTALGVINNLFTVRNAIGSGAEYFQIKYNANDTISVIGRDSGSVVRCNVSSTAVFRDPGAWAHIVISFNASSTILNVYANNVVIANSTSIGNVNYGWNNSALTYHRIGDGALLGEANLNGYMAELYHVDGQALTPSSFGETDSNTGVWKPKAFSGTYGTNGFYLKFADNSGTTSTTLGKDSSGNGNNWTPNNFSVTAGAGNDSLVDSPTSYGTDTGVGGEVRGNYATLSPVSSSSLMTLANGNLDVTSGTTAANGNAYSTISPLTGKFYAEVRVNTGSNADMIGVCPNTLSNSSGRFDTLAGGIGYYYDGQKYVAGVVSNYGSSYTTNDIIGIALDMDAQTVTFYKNNVSQGTISSSMTANVGYYFVSSDASSGNGINHTWNFGQRAFAYTAPSGFKALCTQNLPTPTIGATSTTQANDYFNAVLYTGTAPSTQAVTGVGFQPDFVWVKSRSLGVGSLVYDAVRGAGSSKALQSNATDYEGLGFNVTAASSRGYISSFDSDGFTAADGTTSGQYSKANTSTYVSWNWKANGAGSSNTAGTITSTVSANTTSGFSIVTYTGNGSLQQTVGHGIGIAPQMVILKRRNGSNATFDNWWVYHIGTSNPPNRVLKLNGTDAELGSTSFWWNNPTSTVFGLANTTDATYTNANTGTYVAYCFAPVAGYSAFGSYTGNGSTDGPFVYTGFRPRFVLVKESSAAGNNWRIVDAVRDPYNLSQATLFPSSSQAEGTGQFAIDIVSNGFKLRTADTGCNNNGQTFIYAAFAESPFKYSLAR